MARKRQQQREADELDASLHELLDDLLALTDAAGGNPDLRDPLAGDAATVLEDEDSERSSAAASDQSRGAARTAGDPALRVKKRRRHEVLRLKETASRLENELQKLQRRQVAELLFDDDSDDEEDPSGAKRRIRLRVTAKQQMQAATRAKLENAKLCDAVRAQAAFGSALQEALTKRRHLLSSLEEECLSYSAATAAVAPGCAAAVTSKERTIYDRLSENVDTRTTYLGPVLQLADSDASSAAMFQPYRAESRVLRDGHQSVCIEFAARYVLPFDFQAGAHVIWTQVLSRVPQVTSRSSRTEVVAKTENVLVTKHSATLSYAAVTDSAPLATEYSVSKRFPKAAETEFAWESLTESQAGAARRCASSDPPAINYVEEGWASISHMNTRVSSSAASVVQSHIRLTLSAALDSGDASDAIAPRHLQRMMQADAQVLDVDALSKHIVSVFQKKTETVRCFIESTLLDAALRRSAPVTCEE